MAVYTRVSEAALETFLAQYSLGAVKSFTGIASGIDNTNYLLETDTGKFILTLFETRVKHENLPFYFSFMEHLKSCGLPCAEVIHDASGNRLSALAGKTAAIVSFLEGEEAKNITPARAASIGAMLARMHQAAESFEPGLKNDLSLPAWEKLVNDCLQHTPRAEILLEEVSVLEKDWPEALPKGAIHADLFPDNVFFKGENISGIIDFYFACTDFFAYDLMLTLNAWCFNIAGGVEKERMHAFLKAYESIRPLSKAEKEALPLFGRAAAVRIAATRLYDWHHPVENALVTPKDPTPHLNILKFYRAGGFTA